MNFNRKLNNHETGKMAVDLIYHSTYGQNRKIRNCLREGIHVDALNFNEESSLLHAAKHGQLSTVKLLLRKEANPNKLSSNGLSPLIASAMRNEEKCVEALLENGAVWGLQKMKNNDNIKFKSQSAMEPSTEEEAGKIEPEEIFVLNDSRSIDIFHMFRMKDCLVNNQHCVAKVQLRHSFHHHHVTREEDDEWLLREFQTLRDLRHPHIVRPYFHSISKEQKYNILITEPIGEGNLYHVIYDLKQTISIKICKKVIEEILLAMIYLKSKGIVHNFINSTSVYIVRNWQFKLGNFEYSHREGEMLKIRRSTPVEEFHLPYMAPELVKDSDASGNERTDVYSFGCLSWELLGRKRPWCWLERSDIVSLAQIKHPIILPVPKCWPGFLRAIISHATKLSSDERMIFDELYTDIYRPFIVAETQPVVIVTKDSDGKIKRDVESHVEFFDDSQTGVRNISSTTSADGRTRRGCLKVSSKSEAVIKKAQISGIINHKFSGCLCQLHSQSNQEFIQRKQDVSNPKVASKTMSVQRNNTLINKETSEDLVNQSADDMIENSATDSAQKSESIAKRKHVQMSIPIIQTNSNEISKEQILGIQTVGSTLSYQKQGSTMSLPSTERLLSTSRHERQQWSRFPAKEEDQHHEPKNSFIKTFLQMQLSVSSLMSVYKSLEKNLNCPITELGSSSLNNEDIEKEATLQNIFKTAGRYQKKNWAKATVLDRNPSGKRCYRSKSWCKLTFD